MVCAVMLRNVITLSVVMLNVVAPTIGPNKLEVSPWQDFPA
jgi:hypothetical protein